MWMIIRAELELVRGATHKFNLPDYLAGKLTPYFLVPRWVILGCGKCSMDLLNGRRRLYRASDVRLVQPTSLRSRVCI